MSSILINRHLRVVLHVKSTQEYPVNVEVPQGSILCPALFPLYTNKFLDDVIYKIIINADDITLYSTDGFPLIKLIRAKRKTLIN